MAIKRYKLLFLIFPLIYVKMTTAANIVVERYENWDHPVLKVFKKHSTGLYKIIYSKNGEYPIFCVRLRGNPESGSRENDLDELYSETMEANSYFPYAFADKRFELRVNVDWKNKEKTIFQDQVEKLNPISICDIND